MTTERATIDARVEPIRGPWEQSVHNALPVTVPATDPRLQLTDQALVVASHNAYPIVAGRKTRRDNLGLAAGGAIALVLGCATFVSLNSGRHAPSASTAVATSPATALATRPVMPGPAGLPAMPVPASGAPNPAQPMPMPAVGMSHMPGAMTMPGTPAGLAPTLVFDGSAPRSPTSAPGSNAARDGGGAPGLLAGATVAAGAAAVSDNSSVRSTRLAEPANTVAQGTLIPAVLETAIDSDVPGFVRAVVSQDVRSFDGSRVLIPRSSRLIGEYKAATSAGQRRAYLIWTRLIRPDGVSIALASPAVDFSGQAGIGGKVNSHFFSRFGSAILLSILGGASTLASGGTSVIMSGGESAASAAVRTDSNRAATIRVQQGEPIRVFTARDLIFSETGGNG